MDVKTPAAATSGFAGRSCGHCSLCCRVMGVPEIKEKHQWCRHARVGSGCAIYAGRPNPCRVFNCRWLADDSLPDHWYPAKSKIVIDIQQTDGEFVMVFVVDPQVPLRWRDEPWFSDIKVWAKEGLQDRKWTTVVMVKDERMIITP